MKDILLVIDGNSLLSTKAPTLSSVAPNDVSAMKQTMIAGNIVRPILKLLSPAKAVCYIDSKNVDAFKNISELVEALGISVQVTDGLVRDIRSLVSNTASDYIISSTNLLLTQLMGDGKGIFHHMQEDRFYIDNGVFESIGVEPFRVPIMLALLGNVAANEPPLVSASTQTLAKIINSHSKTSEIVASLMNQFPSMDSAELNRRVRTSYDPAPGLMPTINLEYHKPDKTTLHQSLSSQGLAFWSDAKETNAGSIQQYWGQGVYINSGLSALDAITSTHLDKVFILADAKLASQSLLIISDEVSYVSVMDVTEESMRELTSKLLRDKSDIYTDDAYTLLDSYPELDVVKTQIKSDLSVGLFLLNSRNFELSTKIQSQRLLNIETPSQFDKIDSPRTNLIQAAQNCDSFNRATARVIRQLEAMGTLSFYQKIEAPFGMLIKEIDDTGIKLDRALLESKYPELSKQCESLKQQANDLIGHSVNLDSNEQVSKVLYEELGLKNAGGKGSTSEAALQQLGNAHPFVELLAKYRKTDALRKPANTLLKALDDDDFIHSHLLYKRSVAGRLQSVEVNYQGLPSHTDESRFIREAFVSRFPNGKIIAADYSQIELRILAIVSKDQNLIDQFNAGGDIHATTAARILNKPLGQVSGEERRRAKSVNFGLIYGMTAFGLAKKLGVTTSQANSYINGWLRLYPQAYQYLNELKRQAVLNGKVMTMFGREIHVPEALSSDARQQERGIRQALNGPMQGTGAEIVKMSMLAIADKLRAQNMKTKLMMQVHDELVFDAPLDESEMVAKIVKDTMEHIIESPLTLVADVGIGDNWYLSHNSDLTLEKSRKKEKDNSVEEERCPM